MEEFGLPPDFMKTLLQMQVINSLGQNISQIAALRRGQPYQPAAGGGGIFDPSSIFKIQALQSEQKRKDEEERRRRSSMAEVFGQYHPAAGGTPWKDPDTGNVSYGTGLVDRFGPETAQTLRMFGAVDPKAAMGLLAEQMKPRNPWENYKVQDGNILGIDPQTNQPRVLSQFPTKPPEGFERAPDGSLGPIAGGPADPRYLARKGEVTEPLMRVLNPDGTVKYVPRSQAVGQSAPDEAGLMVTTGPDGKPVIMRATPQGMKSMLGTLGSAAQNEVEKTLVETGGLRQQMASQMERFRPEYQTWGTKLGMWGTALKEKLDLGQADPDTRQKLAEFTQFRSDAYRLFSQYLKTLSGVAVNPTEFKRAEAQLPNPGTGVFDGDSPTEFASKQREFMDFADKATARLHYIQRRGMTINDIPLDQMPQIIEKRGKELEASIGRLGIDGEALRKSVRDQLAREFGLVR